MSRTNNQAELFDTSDAFCLTSERQEDGHQLLAEKIAKIEGAQIDRKTQMEMFNGKLEDRLDR